MAQEIQWGCYVIGDDVPGLTREMVTDYIRYLGNLRWSGLGFGTLYEGMTRAAVHEMGEPVFQCKYGENRLFEAKEHGLCKKRCHC